MAVSYRNSAIAHVLFLVAGLGPLAIGIANFVPMSTGTAGGVGLLSLVPLTLAGFAATVAGVIRTVRLGGLLAHLRRHRTQQMARPRGASPFDFLRESGLHMLGVNFRGKPATRVSRLICGEVSLSQASATTTQSK